MKVAMVGFLIAIAVLVVLAAIDRSAAPDGAYVAAPTPTPWVPPEGVPAVHLYRFSNGAEVLCYQINARFRVWGNIDPEIAAARVADMATGVVPEGALVSPAEGWHAYNVCSRGDPL